MALVAILTAAATSLGLVKAPAPLVPPQPDPVSSTPSPGGSGPSAGDPPVPASLPDPPRPSLASWYGQRPSACWDARGRHSLPAGVIAFTAHRTLPCGTMVTVSGPAGTITIPVWDRGPEAWTGRTLDLSPAAFRAVVGNLWTGVVPVTWRAAA